MITQMTMGVMYFLNQNAIFRFFAPFRNYTTDQSAQGLTRLTSFELSLKVAESFTILFKLLSRLRSISKLSVMILLTSISS